MRWILLLTLAACETVISETRLNPLPATATHHTPNQVEVLASGPPARPHVDVAILVASRNDDTSEHAVYALRTRAGDMGCDAIVVEPVGRVEPGLDPEHLSATCVVYTGATARR